MGMSSIEKGYVLSLRVRGRSIQKPIQMKKTIIHVFVTTTKIAVVCVNEVPPQSSVQCNTGVTRVIKDPVERLNVDLSRLDHITPSVLRQLFGRLRHISCS